MSAPLRELARAARDVRPERMAAMSRLPVFFALEGRRALVAGDSPAAAWKAELLSATGANVHVYAACACEELLSLIAGPPRGAVRLHRRKWSPIDLAGCALAIGDCEWCC
jgi:uroporphyrin-III C-methyltransferase/precorrin-2 dehydrogenase/sirohydrochlorin ferrochelatase